MNGNIDLNDKFRFIIVDDSSNKIEFIKQTLLDIDIEPYVINRGMYCRRTIFTAIEAHEKGKIPAIFLDEYLGTNELDSGTLISFALSEYLKGKGGILFPTSPFHQLQLEKWSKVFSEEQDDWYIEKDLNPLSENFNSREISRVCNEFLSYVDSKEERSERKHG
ncbi:hypothetical protein A3J98_01565 [candidate division WS6 bacterium RIFOXYC1_FULL_33_10]|uniref:Response regulatory domain-containing protein n=2 Tax=Candidatus Dojkabacteria TaxID=74243 RepID=A0A1F4UH95_9BACT|nr:MAG: hypothetical protein A2400_01130 [candidate division WS6 bacterium RIFOXYB1_FULL_33_14]OGC47539.1 MAG: hypothetical protein A3J98_01565 [candidate division WS6 bacterium RIFOXYC1_FULL_33_10]